MILKRLTWSWLFLSLVLRAWSVEKVFDLSEGATNGVPIDFRSTLLGKGKAPEWKTLFDDVPPLFAPLTDKAPAVAKRAVLGQVSQDPTDEHFPMLIYEAEAYRDFTLTTRFKLVSGTTEQMAGVVFRFRDEKNFYVVRASGLGNNVAFYKVINGERTSFFRGDVPITRNAWHELKITSEGNKINCLLDDKAVLPALIDDIPIISDGKFGFWTKSDSVSYFTDTKITYVPREVPAQKMVRDAAQKYNRLKGLKIYTLSAAGEPTILASKDEKENGAAGGKYEKDCITQGSTYYGKDQKTVSVVMPLRDRNGETIAAVRVVMESFPGQTEENAVIRATPIVKEMQARVQTLAELTN